MDARNILEHLAQNLQTPAAGIENEADYLNAAVIVPLVKVDGQLSVLFEVRSNGLAWQPGEICFPGGRIEPDDDSPLAAAMRETVEELGIDPGQIEVLGPLKPLVSPIGVLIYPFVACLSAPEEFRPNSAEVGKIFTVPLSFLFTTEPRLAHMETGSRPLADFPFELVPANYPRDFRVRSSYPVYFFQYKEYVIWGLTGRILQGFLDSFPESAREQVNE